MTIADTILIGLLIFNIYIAFKNDEMHGMIGWGLSLFFYAILVFRYGF